MKKRFNLILISSVLFLSLTLLVLAQDQTATATISGSLDVSVTNSLDYGTVTPGSSSYANSTITVGPANNVNIMSQIKVKDAGLGNLFQHIIFDLNNNGFDEAEISTSTLTKYIDNVPGNYNLPTKLNVPTGVSKGTVNGVITYTFMEKDSSTYYYHPDNVGLNEKDCFDASTKVCISRDLSGPPINAGTETISWGCGKCSDAATITWFTALDTNFKNNCVGGLMPNIVGKALCLRTQTLGDWDLTYSWFESGGGGGFAYTRNHA